MNEIQEVKNALQEADAILIGASNGLSISEGFNIFENSDWFKENFKEFIEKYGIRNVLEGCFTQYPNEEEKWKYWSKLIHLVSNSYIPSTIMKDLYQLVKDKDYFVITSNGEDHFVPSGFDKDKVFELEGKFTEMRCSAECSDSVVSDTKVIEDLYNAPNLKIFNDHLPVCPQCGSPMEVNMATNHNFFQTPSYKEKNKELEEFLDRNYDKKLVILELGVGWRNQMIKAPLMKLTKQIPNTTYITINKGEIYIPDEIQDKSYGLDADISSALKSLV